MNVAPGKRSQCPRRLLVPITHSYNAPKPRGRVRAKSVSGKFTDGSPEVPTVTSSVASRTLPKYCDGFEVIEQEIILEGFQIYAVEKWITQRTAPVILLSVYSGDPKDKIYVSVLAPRAVTDGDSQTVWDRTIHDLRQDGARPRETDQGVIMVTSLANFRSDYTVVYIPGGDFRTYRERLFCNITLLRVGSSGRGALTLQEPSDATKDRFITTYHFREASSSEPTFTNTVLGLLALIQVSLSLFGMYSSAPDEHDGLLCDLTVDGIRRWITEIGEPYRRIDPPERVVDPLTVSALLSLVIAVRNKLSSVGLSQLVPRDPFLYPQHFLRAVAQYVQDRYQRSGSHYRERTRSDGDIFLNLDIMKDLDAAYEKTRSNDAYKVHRRILSKLDGLTAATTSAISSNASTSFNDLTTSGTPSQIINASSNEKDGYDVVPDLSTFVLQVIQGGGKDGKDGVACLRYLWSGRIDILKAKWREAQGSGAIPGAEHNREDEIEKNKAKSDEEPVGSASPSLPWSNKMQKKIENWAGREFSRAKPKKPSVDLTGGLRVGRATHQSPTRVLPSVIVSLELDEQPASGLSSAEMSPISASQSALALGIMPSSEASAIDINSADYERRLANFNYKRPSLSGALGTRLASWSDARAAAEIYDNSELDEEAKRFQEDLKEEGKISRKRDLSAQPSHSVLDGPKWKDVLRKQRRRRSCSDISLIREEDIIPPHYLKIDVDICGQLLIMHRRLPRIHGTIACLEAIVASTKASNAAIEDDLRNTRDKISDLGDPAVEMQKVFDTSDSVSSGLSAIKYASSGFEAQRLWEQASAPRHRVFAIRDTISGDSSGARPVFKMARPPVPSGRRSSRFNRVQWKLDNKPRMVDWMGRTESEAEEESDLPNLTPYGPWAGTRPDTPRLSSLSLPSSEVAEPEKLQPRAGGWFLEFFTRWGRVLGVGRVTADQSKSEEPPKKTEESSSSSPTAQDKNSEKPDSPKRDEELDSAEGPSSKDDNAQQPEISEPGIQSLG